LIPIFSKPRVLFCSVLIFLFELKADMACNFFITEACQWKWDYVMCIEFIDVIYTAILRIEASISYFTENFLQIIYILLDML
jgi:hypothetical protein